jgi:hypothetical protein
MPAAPDYGLPAGRPNSTRPQPRIFWIHEAPRPGLTIRFVC